MATDPFLLRRLANQQLDNSSRNSVPKLVSWLGAVQSQEFHDATWSIAQRIESLTRDAFMQAFNAGTVLRTHVLRPTWHFVTPADIRWMLMLTAPRIKAFLRTNDRKLGLDEAVFTRSNALIEQALVKAGRHLTRTELAEVLRQNAIPLGANALAHLLTRAELEGIVCSGAMRGKHHTFALMAERVPIAKAFSREEALAELATRYFASHGPATVQDFSWWSGLTLTDARAGLESIKSQVVREGTGEKTYWYVPTSIPNRLPTKALLLPNFDEYVVGYADRTTLLEPTYTGELHRQGNILFHKTIVLNGQIAGTWTMCRQKGKNRVELHPLRVLTEQEEAQIGEAVQHYVRFTEHAGL
ncbi:winged helix DNA-binding domain-containing protein [Fibrisoma montanum]|uniref:Winged helix DNA-binding domain-containing protein n=1 Tax=Fibrisoma montanum TaxID=2305895 RepID=A0A418M2Q3_9BACT|nr:winged helix DNA-binding domain-containing protein [Fibrisoma montanum]RIV20021.1 winged helix DNA-binding domain-containing protein [Fibrisoma montanum]